MPKKITLKSDINAPFKRHAFGGKTICAKNYLQFFYVFCVYLIVNLIVLKFCFQKISVWFVEQLRTDNECFA